MKVFSLDLEKQMQEQMEKQMENTQKKIQTYAEKIEANMKELIKRMAVESLKSMKGELMKVHQILVLVVVLIVGWVLGILTSGIIIALLR